MPRKSFEAGMEAGAKPFEEKFRKQADAIEKVGSRIDSRLDEISSVMDVMIEDLSAQERKRVYDLNTVVDISELDKTEKDYLCAIVYAIAGLNSRLSKEQKEYLRALKSYLMITNVQADVNLASIENIDNITTQKAIMQTIMEFLFLEYGNHDYMDDYEDVFDYFSVNRKGIREIQEGIDMMCEAVGVEGIAAHYSFLAGLSETDGEVPDAKEDSMLSKAETAYLMCDMKNAFSLFSYLAEQGNGRACYFLGEIYTNNYGNVATVNKSEAKKYRELGAERGDVLSKLNCAFSLEDKKEKEAIFAEVFTDVLALARQGDVFAMNEVADMFAYGYGTPKNEDNATYWLEESAKLGFWRSINKIGTNYDNQKDYENAFRYYSQAAELGYEVAIFNLGWMYANGLSVSKDTARALEMYKTAAFKGYTLAQLWTGIAYDFKCSEYGVEKDLVEAEKWYRLAADGNNASACWNLAMLIYSKPYGEGRDEEELHYLTKASSLGMEKATVEMAVRLCSGRGVTERMKKEFGEMEWKDSNTFIGAMWDAFTTKDFREEEIKKRGKVILEQFAEKGDGRAQYYLGVLYTDNMYLGKNKDLAKKWIKKAKDNGIHAADYAYSVVSKSFWVLGPSLNLYV